jgi:hypothetical protein
MRFGSYIGVNIGGVALLGTRTYLAVDASCVTAAEVVESVKGQRLRTLAHEPLPQGAVLPGPLGPNLAAADAVRAGVARVLRGVGRARVTLVLPDGVARIALVEPPRGVVARDYLRYRLAASLPWPAAEGVFDALEVGSGRVVGAAVRRATVAEYEQAASAAGANVEQVHLAPLLGLAGLLRERRGDEAHALLGDVAMCLAFVREGGILALRSRRRDRSRGEASRLRAELVRLVSQAANGNGSVPLAVSGSDAPGLRPDLGAGATGNGSAPVPALAGGAAEASWLPGIVA